MRVRVRVCIWRVCTWLRDVCACVCMCVCVHACACVCACAHLCAWPWRCVGSLGNGCVGSLGHVAHMYQWYNTHVWLIPPICLQHVTRAWVMSPTHAWVTSHTRLCHVTHTCKVVQNEWCCHACDALHMRHHLEFVRFRLLSEFVMSHWVRDTQINNDVCIWYARYAATTSRSWDVNDSLSLEFCFLWIFFVEFVTGSCHTRKGHVTQEGVGWIMDEWYSYISYYYIKYEGVMSHIKKLYEIWRCLVTQKKNRGRAQHGDYTTASSWWSLHSTKIG